MLIDTSINVIQGESEAHATPTKAGEKDWHKWTKREDDLATPGEMNPDGEENIR